MRWFLLFTALTASCGAARAQERSCSDSDVTAAVIEQIKQLGFNNPEWLSRTGLHVPYFRMKEVRFQIMSTRGKGPARTGTDCEFVVRMSTPPDVPTPNTVQATFGYIIIPKTSGFTIDLY
jgi:hypothetical protein